jgi:hypothetical protein
MFYNPYVGLLGLAPFPAAFVYTRNAFRAFVVARATGRFTRRLFLLGAVTASTPLLGHVYVWYAVTSAIEEAVSDDTLDLTGSLSTLQRFSFALPEQEIGIAYERDPSGERSERLRRLYDLYRELAGDHNRRSLRRREW